MRSAFETLTRGRALIAEISLDTHKMSAAALRVWLCLSTPPGEHEPASCRSENPPPPRHEARGAGPTRTRARAAQPPGQPTSSRTPAVVWLCMQRCRPCRSDDNDGAPDARAERLDQHRGSTHPPPLRLEFLVEGDSALVGLYFVLACFLRVKTFKLERQKGREASATPSHPTNRRVRARTPCRLTSFHRASRSRAAASHRPSRDRRPSIPYFRHATAIYLTFLYYCSIHEHDSFVIR